MPEEDWETKFLSQRYCSSCDEPIHEGHDYYQCEVCENTYHNECSEHKEIQIGFVCIPDCLEQLEEELKARV